jgi:cell division protein FtsB
MGKLTLLLLVLLGWLQYSLWLGKNGIHDYMRVSEEVEKQQKDFVVFHARNEQLSAEIEDLKSGQQAIEERARNRLNMIKPDESFYRMVPDSAKQRAQRSSEQDALEQDDSGQNALEQTPSEQNIAGQPSEP